MSLPSENAVPGEAGSSPRTRLRGAGLAAALATGWVLHDLAVHLTSGLPGPALWLVGPSLVAVALVSLLGALLVTRRALLATLALAAVASLVPKLVEVPLSRAQIWLPRSIFLLICAWAAGDVLARRGLGAARVGLALGVGACALKAFLHGDVPDATRWLVPPAVVALALGLLRSAGIRRALTLACVAVSSAWVAHGAYLGTLHRPDLPPPDRAAPAGAPNLVLIVLDTVRADRLAPYGYERVTTPGLDAFVREHMTIHTDARSASSWTLPSHASLLTGLLPAEHGSNVPGSGAQPLPEGVTTLAERLRAAGWQTACISANRAYVNVRYGLDRGFERFDDTRNSFVGQSYEALAQLAGPGYRIGHVPYRHGGIITEKALRWLDEDRRDGPFFLMLNYMDAHSPYLPPEPHASAFSDEQPVDPLNAPREIHSLLYDRALRSLDEYLCDFLRGLDERGLLEGTALVITSDHGESLGDHGLSKHGLALWEELVRVPLYVAPAGGRDEPVDPRPVTAVEVHDLLLRAVGLEPARIGAEPPVVSEWYHNPAGSLAEWEASYDRDLSFDLVTWLEGDRKFLVSSRDRVQVFDLSVDPTELSPLKIDQATRARALERAHAWWQAHPVRTGAPQTFDADTLRRMRELGYAGGEE